MRLLGRGRESLKGLVGGGDGGEHHGEEATCPKLDLEEHSMFG